MRNCLILAVLLVTVGCAPYRDTAVPLTTQEDFNVVRYLGTWYEIARYPVGFQRGCTATTATYEKVDAETISVLNQCHLNTPDGKLIKIEGTAQVTGPGQLTVRFSSVPFLRGPYWVLWVDRTYQAAVVGVPNGRAGWILSRRPALSAIKRVEAEEVLRRNGYDPEALVDTLHAKN